MRRGTNNYSGRSHLRPEANADIPPTSTSCFYRLESYAYQFINTCVGRPFPIVLTSNCVACSFLIRYSPSKAHRPVASLSFAVATRQLLCVGSTGPTARNILLAALCRSESMYKRSKLYSLQITFAEGPGGKAKATQLGKLVMYTWHGLRARCAPGSLRGNTLQYQFQSRTILKSS